MQHNKKNILNSNVSNDAAIIFYETMVVQKKEAKI
jgi:hypothetical protein